MFSADLGLNDSLLSHFDFHPCLLFYLVLPSRSTFISSFIFISLISVSLVVRLLCYSKWLFLDASFGRWLAVILWSFMLFNYKTDSLRPGLEGTGYEGCPVS